MSHDELRRALRALAGEAPLEPRRSEQVWARHRRTRRKAVALTVGAALAVLSGVALMGPSDGSEQGLVTRSPTASPGLASPTSSATAPPAAGEPTASPTATPAPPATAPTQPSVFGPPSHPAAPEPPAGVLAYAKWHNNLGEPTGLVVYPYALDAGVDDYTVDWGDGSEPNTTSVGLCWRVHGRHRVSAQAWEQAYTYHATGEFLIRVTVRFGGCGHPARTRTTTTRVLVDTVATGVPGVASANIALKRVAMRSKPAKYKLAMEFTPSDPDSYIAFVFVEWQDGTVTVLRQSVPSWCSASPAALDPDWPAYVEHTFPEAGEYQVSATVHSATCDGGPGSTTMRSTVVHA